MDPSFQLRRVCVARSGIVKPSITDVSLPNKDIWSFLLPQWKECLHLEALECLTSGRKMTYGELLDASLRFGSELHRLVPHPSSLDVPPRVTIFSHNLIEYGPIVLGTLAAGWTLNTMNPYLTTDEVIYQLNEVQPKVLVFEPTLEETVNKALEKLDLNTESFCIGKAKGGNLNVQTLMQDVSQPKIEIQKVDPSSPAVIIFSSATTAKPKGVVHSHASLTNNLICFNDPRIFFFGPNDEHRQTLIVLTPFYHIYGYHVQLIGSFYFRAKVLIIQEYNTKDLGNIISKYKIQVLYLVPTLLNYIINAPDITREQLASVKCAIIGGAAVLPAATRKFQEKASEDVIFQEVYGMTETMCSHLTPKDCVRIGSCGKLIPNVEAKIIDTDTKMHLGPNQVGELLVRSKTAMSYYLNNPSLTAETVDADGWLHTGDIALYDEDYFFRIIDRAKDIIRVNTHKVSPAEIENVLMQHEAVAEAGVIGIPDGAVGEVPRAYVSRKRDVTEDELIAHVERHLSPEKRLAGGVQFIPQLPKSQAGKILRRELREMSKK